MGNYFGAWLSTSVCIGTKTQKFKLLNHISDFYIMVSKVFSMQATYSPLYCDGIGLSDGEVMERLWSYLRGFSRMTKEMCPSHHIDVLSHALLYYGYKSKKKLCEYFSK